MKSYKRKYQAEYMCSDHKPKGRTLKKIQASVRQFGKKDIGRQLIDGLKEAIRYEHGEIALRTTSRDDDKQTIKVSKKK